MNFVELMKKYLDYCQFRKELDWNTLKAYRIDLRQFLSMFRKICRGSIRLKTM